MADTPKGNLLETVGLVTKPASLLDVIAPIFVGKRTETLTAIYAILRIISIFWPDHLTNAQVDQVGEVIRPLAAGTLAAKLNRIA